MKREKLIFVVVFMVCSFIGGRLFAGYDLGKSTWYVVDCGASLTSGTTDYADGLDEGDSIGYRLDCSIGPLGDVHWEPEASPTGTIVESGFYHVNYSTWFENPTFVFDDADISSTTIRFTLHVSSINPPWTQYAIAFSTAVNPSGLFTGTTDYINKNGDTVTSWDEIEDWNPASFYEEEVELTQLHPNTIYGFKIRSKSAYEPPELPTTDWSGDTENYTWTHIETPVIAVTVYITSATVDAGSFSNLGAGLSGINFGRDESWTGWITYSSHTFDGLDPNTSYIFDVKGRDGENPPYETEVVSVAKYTLCTPPVDPYIPDVSVSSCSLTLVWSHDYLGQPEEPKCYLIKENEVTIVRIIDNYTETSLERNDLPNVNHEYIYKIYAVNNENEYDEISSVTISTYTKCSIPPAPQIVDISADTISIEINSGEPPGKNPPYTEFSIKVSSDAVDTRFVQDDHTLGYDEVFHTIADWVEPLTSTVTINGLGSNVEYEISVQAMNWYGHVTGYGASVSSCTYASVPGLILEEQGNSAVRITIDEGNNSSGTEYAIELWANLGAGWVRQGYLLEPDGIDPFNAYWQTKDDWDGYLHTGLNLDLYGYKYRVMARRTVTGYSKKETNWSSFFYAGNVLETPTAWILTEELKTDTTYYYSNGKIVTFSGSGVIHSTYTTDGSIPPEPTELDPEVDFIDLTAEPGSSITYKIKAKAWQGELQSDVGGPWTVVIDRELPELEAFSINWGEEVTNSRFVTLVTTATGADYIHIDGDVDDYYKGWFTYSPEKQVWLTPDEGDKTVSVKVKDEAENEVGPLDDSIKFDPNPPLIKKVQIVKGTVKIDYTNSEIIKLYIEMEAGEAVYMWIEGNVIDGTDTVDTYDWILFDPQPQVTLESEEDGEKTVSVKVANGIWTPSGYKSDSVELDRVVQTPTLSLSSPVSGSQDYTSNPVEVSIDNLDADVDWYILSDSPTYATQPNIDDQNWTDDVPVPIPVPFILDLDLSGNDGLKTVYLWVKDRAENISVEVASDTIRLDTHAPQINSFSIDKGDYTNSPDINLTIDVDYVNEMLIGGNVEGPGDWTGYSASTGVTLTAGDGPKIVTIKFKDEAGNEAPEPPNVITSTITLDMTPPVMGENIGAEFVKHDVTLEEGVVTTCHKPTFSWQEADDNLSGVAGYSVSFSSDTNDEPDVSTDTVTSSFELELTQHLYNDGTYYFKVMALDNADNWSVEVASFTYRYRADWESPKVNIDIEGKKRIRDEVKGVEEEDTLPEIRFDKEVWGVERYVEVEIIRDNEGKKYENRKVSCEISTSTVLLWKADPGKEWGSNYTYRVKVNTEIEDKAGNALEEGKELIFTTMLDHTKINVVLWESEGDPEDPKTKMILEANALKEDGYILINLEPLKEAEPASKEAIKEADEKVKNNGDIHCYDLVESLREMRGYTKQGGDMATEFLKSVYIELPYGDEDKDKDGIVDSTKGTPAEVSEQTLSIYWLDEKHNLWVKVPGTKVDRKKNVARAKVTGFGIYTLMGGSFYDLSNAYAYPVPYKPNDGNDSTGTEEEGITFTGLSTEAEIKIYTITGELVKKLTHKSGFVEEWYPVENEKGETVVSGVYIYYLKNDKEHKSGKLVIIR